MDRFGLIGFPISHSLSPMFFRQAYGDRFAYDLLEHRDFEGAWKEFTEGPYRAVNVTAPFKTEAAARADIVSPEVERTSAANILLKTEDGIAAYNSDYLGLRRLLGNGEGFSAAVIGTGGAGRAAIAAAEDNGFMVSSFHHDEIENGVRADVIIYTLPKAVPGLEALESGVLVEANYKDPCLTAHPGYISGRQWLVAQAEAGFALMTGEKPEKISILQSI